MIFGLFTISATTQDHRPTTVHDVITEAWAQAQKHGTFAFQTAILQTTTPTLTIENVGRSPSNQHLYIEGNLNRADDLMQMRLWSQGGSVVFGNRELEIKVENGTSYGRTTGQGWREIDDFTGLFAPGNDPLAFLQAAEEVTQGKTQTLPTSLQSNTDTPSTYTPYTFRLNSTKFAAYMRNQTESAMRKQGELPMGVQLDMASQFRDMDGEGEIWLNDKTGLPLRMTIDLVFPPDDVEQFTAQITTDFTNWETAPVLAPNANLPNRLAYTFNTLAASPAFQKAFSSAAAITLVLAFSLAMLFFRRAKSLYAAFAAAMIASMIFVPMLQSQQVYAYNQTSQARQLESEKEIEQNRLQKEWEASQRTTDFDPLQDPLPQLEIANRTPEADPEPGPYDDLYDSLPLIDDGTDSDGDGLTDVEEILTETDPKDADTDDDGLNDGVEIFQLGTDATEFGADTDGDTLSDYVEVQGFAYNSQQWYLDPLSSDSNRDGALDGTECYIDPDTDTLTCPDTDGNGIPDVFDDDNDGDGVRDLWDLAPNTVVGDLTNGLADDVFRYNLTNYAADKPLYVDFQLRPTDPNHLWYTLNVLDWPSNDREGQIQRVFDTTFYDAFSGGDIALADNDPQFKDGDLRLIPMLEIVIPFEEGHYANLPVIDNAPVITATTPVTAWLDTNVMTSFGIVVRKLDNTGTLAAYVPLILEEETKGQGPTSFTGRMFYQPTTADFGPAHESQLIWMVQGITDTCLPTADDYAPENVAEGDLRKTWCADDANWVTNPPSILHIYEDSWNLTGMVVKESLGTDVSVVYQDPAYTTALPTFTPGGFLDDNLWTLAQGLERSYLAGRGDTTRDFTLSDLATRFDKRQNSAATEEQRWNIPQDAFFVDTFNFAHLSEIVALPITHTPQILNDTFTAAAVAGDITDPTLLFVREERFRTMSTDFDNEMTILNEGARENGVITSNSVSLSLNPETVIPATLASMNWAPYRYENDAWETYPIEDYWVDKGTAFETALSESWDDPDDVLGARMIAQSYYLTLYSGLSQIIQLGEVPTKHFTALDDGIVSTYVNGAYDPSRLGWSIDNIVESFDTFANLVGKQFGSALNFALSPLSYRARVAKAQANLSNAKRSYQRSYDNTLPQPTAEKISLFSKTAQYFKPALFKPSELANGASDGLGASRSARSGSVQKWMGKTFDAIYKVRLKSLVGVNIKQANSIVDIFAAATQIALTFTGDINDTRVGFILATIQFGTALIGAVDAVSTYVTLVGSAVVGGKEGTSIAGLWNKALSRANPVGIIFTMIIVAVISVALFVFQIVKAEIEFGSLPFNKALAGLIAGLIVATIIVFFSSIPIIGQLIASIVGIIDATILLICYATGVINNEDEKNFARDWICPGITGLLTKAVEFLIYDQTPIVDLSNENRLQIADFRMEISDRNAGIKVNNGLELALNVQTALYRDPFSIDDVNPFIVYRYQFGDQYVAESTFDYQILRAQTDFHESLRLKDMENDWRPPAPDDDVADAVFVYTETVSSDAIQFVEAGINEPLPGVYLAEAYVINTQECFMVPNPILTPPTIPICYLRAEGDTNHINLGANIIFDVFPETVGEFYALSARDDGYTLAWWMDQPVSALLDADGDNLISKEHGGIDPNDSLPDTDGDELSDLYELQNGTEPAVADIDEDGLNDYEELKAGTNPYQADTDNDGLTDAEEIEGWAFVYTYVGDEPQTTWVYSNPLLPNEDGDDYLDAQEKAFGFHPQMYSSSGVLELSSNILDEDAIYRPNETINYQVILENQLDTPNLLGLLEVEIPATVNSSTFTPEAFILTPKTVLTTTGSVVVDSLATTQQVSMTNVAGAVAVDLQAERAGRTLWLHLEENATGGTTTFADSSAYGHDGTCIGDNCPYTDVPTIGRVPGYQNYGAYFQTVVSPASKINLPGTFKEYGIARGSYTVLAWFNGINWTGKKSFLSESNPSNNNFVLGFDGRKPFFGFAPSELSSVTFTSNEWHQIAWRYYKPTNEHSIYIDGVQVMQSTTIDMDYEALADEGLFIGKASSAWGRLDSVIDEVEIFPYALSEEALGGKMTGELGQVFYFNFDDWIEDDRGIKDNSIFRNQVDCAQELDSTDYFKLCPSSGEFSPGNGMAGESYAFQTESGSEADILYVSPNPNLELNRGEGAFTLSVWLKKLQDGGGWLLGNSSSGFPRIQADGSGLNISFGSGTDSCGIELSDVQNFTSESADSFWHHLVVSFDGVTLRIVLNGKELDKTDCSGKRATGDGSFYIGNRENSDSQGYNGSIDELRIFNYVLGDAEIDDLYWDTSPMLELRFDESPARTEFKDRSLTPNNGTCAGDACPISGVQGRSNQAVLFDGVDDRILVANTDELTLDENSFTIATWIKPNDLSYDQGILGVDYSSGATYMRMFLDDGKPGFSLPATEIIGADALEEDRWYHLVARYNYTPNPDIFSTEPGVGDVEFFVDGVSVGSATGQKPVVGSDPFYVGFANNDTSYYSGLIDQVQLFRIALTDDQIQELREQMPTINLHLDERDATTSFTNDGATTNSATCTEPACPTPGIKGKMYQGIAFDGEDDKLSLSHSLSNVFSIGTWVKPLSQKSFEQPIFDRTRIANPIIGEDFKEAMLRVAIAPNSMNLRVHTSKPGLFGIGCSATAFTTEVALIQNTWNHVMLTSNGKEITFYVNGSEAYRANKGSWCKQSASLILGSSIDTDVTRPFAGELDEFVYYPSALSKDEVSEFVTYQSQWYDTSYAHDVLIDADKPVITLGASGQTLPNEPIILAATAVDPTTEVIKVEFNINDGSWEDATRDGDLWLFAFTPTGDGRYKIDLRATDTAGNIGTNTPTTIRAVAPPTGETVLVDGTPPSIGLLNVEADGGTLPPVIRNPKTKTWRTTFVAEVDDTNTPLQVFFTIYNAAGAPVSNRLLASGPTNTNEYTIAYPFDIQPNGTYTITVEAVDPVGNTTVRSLAAEIDGTPPVADIQVTTPITGLLTTPAMVTGTVTEVGTARGIENTEISYVPTGLNDLSGVHAVPEGNVLHITLDEQVTTPVRATVTRFIDQSGYEFHATCSGETCPSDSLRAHLGNGVNFDGVDDVLEVVLLAKLLATEEAFSLGAWVKPDSGTSDVQALLAFAKDTNTIPSLQLTYDPVTQTFLYQDLATGTITSTNTFTPDTWHYVFITIGADNVGTLYVDGSVEATFTTSARPNTDDLLLIGQAWNGTSSQPFSGMIDDLVAYNRALTATEAYFLARGSGPIIRLALEDDVLVVDGLIKDSSRYQIPAYYQPRLLNTIEYPSTGIVGARAYTFDDKQYISIPPHEALDFRHGAYTQMAWVYPTDDGPVFSGLEDFDNPHLAAPSWEIKDNNIIIFFGDGVDEYRYTANNAITLGAWNFVAVTFDGTSLKVYVDGVLQDASETFAGKTPASTGELTIGRGLIKRSKYAFFEGMLDEISMYAHALDAATISALYHQGWQTTTLNISGSGITSTVWSHPVPEALFGSYQIQLRTNDGTPELGNISLGAGTNSTWEGFITNNKAPIANAGSTYNIDEGTVSQLDATNSTDPDNDLLRYLWDLDNDGIFETRGVTPTIDTSLLDGPATQKVTLRVNDGRGGSTEDTATINVANVDPIAHAGGAYTVTEGTTLQLSGSADDIPADIITYQWDLNDDNIYETIGQNPTFDATTLDGPATYPITLLVSDDDGGTHTESTSITVINATPTVDAGGTHHVGEGSIYEIVGVGTDVISDTLTYEWDANDDSVFEISGDTLVVDASLIDGPALLTATLRISDDDAASDTDIALIHIVNISPTLSALNATEIDEGGTMTLTGQINEPGANDALTLVVDWKDGSQQTIPYPAGTTAFTLTHTYADDQVQLIRAVESYNIMLTISDDDGGETTVNTPITVNNLDPSALIGGPYLMKEGEMLNLLGFGTDVPTDPVTYAWDLDNDGIFETSGQTPVFDATALDGPSIVTITLRVTDDDGGAKEAQTTITLLNVAPQIDRKTFQIAEGTLDTLSASATDVVSDTLIFRWDLDGNGSFETLGQTPIFDASALDGPTTVTVTLQVSDDDGGQTTAPIVIQVDNLAPSADAGTVYSVAEGSTVALAGVGTDIPSDPLSYAWDLDGNGSFETSGQTPIFDASALDGPSVKTVTLQVTDDDGGVQTSSADIRIENASPNVNAGGNQTVTPFDTVSLLASFIDPASADTHTAKIDWGDGTIETVPAQTGQVSSTHRYTQGEYTVTVSVTDDDGGKGSDSFVVTVGPAQIYLPLVVTPPEIDLVVKSLVANSNGVTVTIQNLGVKAVQVPFWVDLYYDPDTPPTTVNQIWSDLGQYGAVWGVGTPIPARGKLTLTLNDSAYQTAYSNLPTELATGKNVYVQVDSWDEETTYGAVQETHELNNGSYNNISRTTVQAAIGMGISVRKYFQ